MSEGKTFCRNIIGIIERKTVGEIYIIALPVYNGKNLFIHNIPTDIHTQRQDKGYGDSTIYYVDIFQSSDISYACGIYPCKKPVGYGCRRKYGNYIFAIFFYPHNDFFIIAADITAAYPVKNIF